MHYICPVADNNSSITGQPSKKQPFKKTRCVLAMKSIIVPAALRLEIE